MLLGGGVVVTILSGIVDAGRLSESEAITLGAVSDLVFAVIDLSGASKLMATMSEPTIRVIPIIFFINNSTNLTTGPHVEYCAALGLRGTA